LAAIKSTTHQAVKMISRNRNKWCMSVVWCLFEKQENGKSRKWWRRRKIKNRKTLHEVFVKKQQYIYIYIVAHDPMLYVQFFSLLLSVKKTWFSEYEISEIWWTSWLIEQYAFLRYLWKRFFSCCTLTIKKITNI